MLHWTGAAGRRTRGIAFVFLAATAMIAGPARAQSADVVPVIHLDLQPENEAYESLIRDSAQRALVTYGGWLGPAPLRSVTIVDRPWCSERADAPGLIVVHLPWWSAPPRMQIESQVAFGLATQWWPALLQAPDTRAIALGLARYLQSRVVEDLFDRAFLRTAHSVDGVRFFGGAVPRTFRLLRLDRWTGGLGRADFVRRDEAPGAACRGDAGIDVTTARFALAFGTLERYLGWPALQGALRALAAESKNHMARSEVEDVIGAAVGQDLSWFFDAAFDRHRRFAYAVRSLSTAPAASCTFTPCFRTQVVVGRDGDAVFSGLARETQGSYASGDAMELRVEFADGQVTSTRWDGRDESRTFEFESAEPATAARLDPDRVLLLDDNYLDNALQTRPDSNVPVTKWAARWLVWLQNAMLTYAF